MANSSDLIQACVARRAALLDALAPNSVAVIPSAQLQTRSNDTEFAFRQDSDFFYLTGFNEPDALLILSNLDGHFSTLFCQPKDPLAEIWHGRRLGVEQACDALMVDSSHSIDELDEHLLDYLDGHEQVYFAQGQHPQVEEMLFAALQALRNAPKQSRQAPSALMDIRDIVHEMRLFKSDFEVAQMQKAANISCLAHTKAMQVCAPGKNEYHLEAQLHYEFAMHGARHPAYGTIVGGGVNGCILHYTENNCELGDGDLVLIDAGAEYNGYAADITRTFPVSGRFSPAQRQLYQLVLDAQLASFEHFKPGGNFKQANDTAILVLTKGLIDLGLLSGDVQDNIENQTYRQFFMHGIGHWLGLDVHDVGKYKINGQDRPFEPGMVMTVEPGLYVAPDAPVDEQWRGIGIRIEDNLLITSSGHVNLTANVVKEIDDIEALMAG